MKAKEWYKEFEKCSSADEFEDKLEEFIRSLESETMRMVETRHCKTDEAILGCIHDSDQKWKAIISIHKKKLNDDNYYLPEFLRLAEFFDDGFKAVFTQLHPEYKRLFDLDKHMKFVNEKIEQEKQKASSIHDIFMHKVIPYEELTMDNLTKEIINCSAALGSYVRAGFNLEWLKPLAQRIDLLRYWRSKGSINLDDVKEFEEDPAKWVQDHSYTI